MSAQRQDRHYGATARWLGVILWMVALALMLGAAAYQRLTGPTVRMRGQFAVSGQAYRYRLPRSGWSFEDARVAVAHPGGEVSGSLHYRRYGSVDDFTVAQLRPEGTELVGMLPTQPATGKLEYFLVLNARDREARIPVSADGNVVIRFKDDVPLYILLPHILFMFFAMLIGLRAGLSGLFAPAGVRPMAWVTLGGMTIGGFILGPIAAQYAFGQAWTGFPVGFDWTDNKTLLMWLAWAVACAVLGFKPKHDEGIGRVAAAAAAVVMMAVYLIPHSV